MDKKIAGLLGAVATLGALGAAQAAPVPVPADVVRANSFAGLLEPIPNAASLLQVVDKTAPAPEANVELAQLVVVRHHHHHHHHHMRRHHHHHHHHHHHRH